MTRIRPWAPAGLALLAGLAGCHLTPKAPTADLEPGRGRVERAYAAGVEPTFKATLMALDDLGVRPEQLDLGDGSQDIPFDFGMGAKPGDPPRKNLDAFGNGGDGLHELFARHRMKLPVEIPGQAAAPLEWNFDPTLLTYRGKAADGRAVQVVARARRFRKPGEAGDAETTVLARVGPEGDEAWGRSFLDKVAARVEQERSKPAAAPGVAAARTSQEVH